MKDYLKYLLPAVVVTLTGVSLLAGGVWAWVGVGFFVVLAIPDSLRNFALYGSWDAQVVCKILQQGALTLSTPSKPNSENTKWSRNQ